MAGRPTLFPANIATCPNCQHTFEHNRVNGVSLVAAVNDIDARKRMHCRLALDTIETHGGLSEVEFRAIRKVLMDSFNDFNRDVQTILGLADDVE